MNVVIANKYKDLLNNLDIEIIKSLEGVYDAQAIGDMFKNFYFDKMILDITSIDNYEQTSNLMKITDVLDMNKVIFFLDDNEICSSKEFLSSLVSLGIYNFTRNIEGVMHLLNTPNKLENVKSLLEVDEPKKEPKNEELTSTIKVPDINDMGFNPYVEKNSVNTLSEFITDKNTSFNNEEENVPLIDESKHNMFGFRSDEDDVITGNLYDEDNYNNYSNERRVIGIKNLTEHAGATSLIYMMINELKGRYNVVAIEVDKLDFTLFKDKIYISCSKMDLVKTIQRYSTTDIIFVDLNNYDDLDVCDDVLYLVEPSKIKLDKLVLKDKDTFKKLKKKKIILNKSLLNNSEVNEFEYEARTKVFYNMPPQNDRSEYNEEIVKLLKKLNFNL